MRRVFACVGVLLIVLCLGVTAFAQTNAPQINITVSISPDGTAQITQIVQFQLEVSAESVSYPIPLNARDITVNGTSITPSRDESAAYIAMSRVVGNVTGTFPTTFSYTLNNVVTTDEDGLLVLNLPLLSGFAFPVQSVEINVTLPGNTDKRPTFSSGYFKERIQESMDVVVEGNRIEARLLVPLKDRETLQMELMVDETLFPPSPRPVWTAGTDDFAMIVLAVLAVVYWFAFLRCLPVLRKKRANAPDSISAGELGSVMVMQGADLTMMVVSWAQLGYILIQLDNNGRVLLHKRMEMGNERSAFEVRSFNTLFGKRRIVDGTGYHYARLCRKIAASGPAVQGMYDRRSGNPKLLRGIAAGAGLFGGISLGIAFAYQGFLGVLITFALAIFGLFSAWMIQSAGYCLHLKNKQPIYIAAALCAVWIVLGLLAGELHIALLVACGKLLAGILAAYGGMRTTLGKQTLQQIYGLRHHLKTVSREELQRLMKINPSYFYTMAPYALAFGVDQVFAKRFGAMRLSGCPYLTTGMDGHLTAQEWSKLLRKAVDILDARQKQLPLEKLLG
jgi:hypothetical protein